MNRLQPVGLWLPLLALILGLAGCAGGVSSGTPSASPPTTSVTSPGAAAARVQEVVRPLGGIGEKQPDVIGACCFWEAERSPTGFRVVFEVGWGDCPSGCIDRHRWTYDVSADGAVQLAEESGPAVPPGVPGSGVGGGSATPGGGAILPGGSGITGRVTAGPTCPVVTVDNPCDDRPIAGVPVVVLDVNGREVGRVMTDAEGRYSVTLPSGPYTIEPQPIEGLMRAPEPTQVTVDGGFVTVDLSYDTGIR